MKLPRKVYVIMPFDHDKKIAGVYVGSSANLQQRIMNHLNSYSAQQKELHDLMRKNGFEVCVVDDIENIGESHLEYDWIEFFKERTHFKVFNFRQDLCGADWHRLKVSA